MRPRKAICFAFLVVTLHCATCTIITGTLLTGFVGGFLMGKITLGTFLAVMNTLNQQQQPKATVQAGTPITTAPRVVVRSNELSDIPESVEKEVRDKFLYQLAKMDPLNCLPKVFCEISADPNSATQLFDVKGMKLKDPIFLDDTYKRKPLKGKKHGKGSAPGDEEEDDNNDDNSESNEDDDDDDDDDDVLDDEERQFKEYEQREAYEIETKALEEMLDKSDDPMNYYFILKDKKKNVHPKLYEMLKDEQSKVNRRGTIQGLQNPSRNLPTTISKRIDEIEHPVMVETIKTSNEQSGRTTEDKPASIGDAFEDDPFFTEFSESLRQKKSENMKNPGSRWESVGLLRRSKRASYNEDDIMQQYRLAAKVAEKYKNPQKCQRAFITCPFKAEEVMKMITKLNAQPDTKTLTMNNKNRKNYGASSMRNLENTLTAIEKLNNVTLKAKGQGLKVDYGQLFRDAMDSQETEVVSVAGKKIMEDFEGIADEITPRDQFDAEFSKRNNEKTGSKSTSKSKKVGRPSAPIHRRNTDIRFASDETVMLKHLRFRRATKTVKNYKKATIFGNPLDEDCDDAPATIQTSPKPIKVKKSRSEDLSENDSRSPESRRVINSSEEDDDDEAIIRESEEHLKVPTFSQTYAETFQSPPKTKTRPRPVYSLPKIKPFLKRTTTPSPTDSTSTTVQTKITSQTSINQKINHSQKFSGELEDDEEDAKNSEDAIEELLSKHKTKKVKA